MDIAGGIDIGSVTTKCVILADGRMAGKGLARTSMDTEKTAEAVFREALAEAGLSREEVGGIVSTGYGRRLFGRSDAVITEISAVARGVAALTGGVACTILDMGGQDTKVIETDGSGEVLDFMMNDKCAAGTGRFLEIMAGVLETDLEGLSRLAAGSTGTVTINSTCSVFAESEVVSLIAAACSKEDIASGIFSAIAARNSNMIKQFDLSKPLFFCGGGARSAGMCQALEASLGLTLRVLDNPQYVAALGAATCAKTS